MREISLKLNAIEDKINKCIVERFSLELDIKVKERTPPKETENTFTWKNKTQNKYVYNLNRWKNKLKEMQFDLTKKENQIAILNKKKLDVIYSDDELTSEYLELEWE